MVKLIRTADLSARTAAQLMTSINPGIEYVPNNPFCHDNVGAIITETHPRDLIYPEGWYFSKGNFRNKHNTSSGVYEEIPMIRRDGSQW